MSFHQERTAVRVANIPQDRFEREVESERPPTVTRLWNSPHHIGWAWAHTELSTGPRRRFMRVIPRMHASFARLAVRVANTGGSFAFAVAYLLFALMFLLMVADTILAIVRAW
jgi:hypothetical protein